MPRVFVFNVELNNTTSDIVVADTELYTSAA